MKRKIKILITAIGICLSGCGKIIPLNENKIENAGKLAADSSEMTVREASLYLRAQKDHYPLSDEFIERYQQNSGGYLDYAKELGKEVNRQKHLPDQKWHFFDSWLNQSIAENPYILEQSAKTRIYSNLLCPELLLWIFEASNIDPVKLRNAFKIAETDKAKGITTSSIAKDMKTYISWEDIQSNILSATYDKTEYKRNITVNGEGATLVGTDPSGYVRGSKVQFTVGNIPSGKMVDTVSIVGYIVNSNSDGSYYFYMPDKDVTLDIKYKNLPDTVSITLGSHAHTTVKINGSDYSNPIAVSYGSTVNFTVTPESGYEVTKVIVNNKEVAGNEGNYSFTANENSEIKVFAKDPSSTDIDDTYNVVYDMGESKSAVAFTSNKALFDSLKYQGKDEGVIESVSDMAKNDSGKYLVYGGGKGGSKETTWYANNVIKLGSTSVTAYFDLSLSDAVNKVIITGYTSSASCKLRVGDSTSTDWDTSATPDNKTMEQKTSSITIISKEALESGSPSSITYTFTSTNSLRIGTTNTTSSKYPFYITAIELIYDSELGK